MITKYTDLQKLALDVYSGRMAVDKYSKEDGENAIRNAITEACNGEWNYYNFMDNRYKVFAVMSEVLSIATGTLLTNAFDTFVETRDTNLGDKPEFIVEDNSLFRVATISAGNNDLRRQKLYGKKLPITTSKLGVKIYEELDMFLAGRVDFTKMINKVALSYQVEIGSRIYSAIYDSYNSLVAPYQVNGTYSVEKMQDLIAHVQAGTGQAPVIYGTKKSLGKVLGADPVLVSNERKNELASFGHYKDFQGTPMIELPQAHKPGTTNFVVDDSFLIVAPNGEKIVKLLLEGDAYIFENMEGSNRNDQQIEYEFARKIGIGVLQSNVYGIFRIG
jgi:hypothetical protein